ncbi:hypothetical protein Nepgr_025892 [Nepenthes gracilis]|uniref:Uncharacterized protein n=1 Tax=Nepenthes gracilis TaxID=150966 RepID=A0AAD3T7X2_NEPGR|nr:hypothetical protein Nepgr_025892 [Nepenthes gracilis]
MPKSRNAKATTKVIPLMIFLISPLILSPMPVVLGSSNQKFHRPDPLRRFKYYRGGYDLKNKHYWASTAFTGVHGYAVAIAWLLCGLGFGISVIVKNICGGSSFSPVAEHSDSSYCLVFLLVVFFSLLAATATGFVLVANQHSLQTTKGLKSTLLRAGSDARRRIHRANKAMKDMQFYLCTYDQNTCSLLNKTSHGLGNESRAIQQFVQKSGHSIDIAIWTSYIVNLVVVVVNMVFLVAALVFFLLHWEPGFIIIIFFFWIITMACWVLTGVDFFLHNFAEDTCVALHEFLENPENNSLSSLMPCSDLLKAESIMVDIGRTIHNFISELNSNIMNLPKQLRLNDQNDVSRGIWKVCDPFSGAPDYSYVPGKCPKDAIPIGKVPEILARFTCQNGNDSAACGGDDEKFLGEAAYPIAYAYSHSIQDLINIYPDLESLIHCSFVKSKISEVDSHQCRPFMASTRLLWESMLSLSTIMVVLTIIWSVKAYRDRRRSFSRFSVIPNSTQS